MTGKTVGTKDKKEAEYLKKAKKRRKIITVVVIVVLLLAAVVLLFAKYPGLVYSKVDNGYEVSDYRGFAKRLTVPAEYMGEPVVSIGIDAFSNCDSLEGITLPDTVTYIEHGAFEWGDNLTFVNIPESVTFIGHEAFCCLPSLTSVTIPAAVTEIGTFAFAGCSSLTEITVSPNNEYYCTVDGVLYNKDKTTLVAYPAGRTDETFTVPDGVTYIESGAFAYLGDAPASITIPDSVTEVSDHAFLLGDDITIYAPHEALYYGFEAPNSETEHDVWVLTD